MNLIQVDPKTLVPNPANPRLTKPDAGYDAQLTANIREIGLIQPPIVREIDGKLVIKAGDRRTRACIAAGLATIPVLVMDGEDANNDGMRAFSENIVRAGLGTVDTWRAIEALCGDGWTDDGIATALSLQPRVIKRLKLCGSIHPAILDQMAKGDEPNERDLRIIASAPREDQAEAWKKHKPKKGERVTWWDFARALTKTRFYARDASFDAKIAKANGIVWQEDLFEQGDGDNRYTTQGEAFINAQHEHMNKKLAKGHVILTIDEHGQPKLPAKATRIYGTKPGKGDTVGTYVNERSGSIETVIYRLPEPKTPAGKAKGKGGHAAVDGQDGGDEGVTAIQPSTRPPVTQEGVKMIGDFQTDALHEALMKVDIDAQTMIALLVLALAGKNVSIRTGESIAPGQLFHRRDQIAAMIIPGGDLTADPKAIDIAARTMLQHALSLRVNFGGNSGAVARIAGEAINAKRFLPTMATQEFLSCLSKPEIERVAASSGILPRPTGKATRAAVVEHFKEERYIHEAASFALAEGEVAKLVADQTPVDYGAADEDDTDGEGDDASNHASDEDPEHVPQDEPVIEQIAAE